MNSKFRHAFVQVSLCVTSLFGREGSKRLRSLLGTIDFFQILYLYIDQFAPSIFIFARVSGVGQSIPTPYLRVVRAFPSFVALDADQKEASFAC